MKPLVAVFAVALLARLAAQAVLGAFVHPETWEYEVIANNLLSGHGYTYVVGDTAYVAYVSSPLYVLLTAGTYLLTGHSQPALLVMQALFGAATALLAAWLAARVFRPEAGWVAGCLVALDPGLLVYASKLHPLTIDAFAFLALVCACVALRNRPRWQDAARLGLLVGVVALTRTTVLSLLPILVWWAHRFRALSVAAAAVLVLIGLVVYSPWPLRNSLLLGQFVPGSSESTEWLWRGSNPNATGSSLTSDGRSMLDAAPSDFQSRIGTASEAERMGIYRDAAVQFIAQHPVDALRLYLLKLKGFWWGSETTGLSYPAAWTVVYDAWYASVLVLGVVGAWWGWRAQVNRSAMVLIVASLALISLTQALFYVEGRHRLAVEPLVLVLAGVGVVYLASLIQVPRWQTQRRRLT